jgi:hypothetical protein
MRSMGLLFFFLVFLSFILVLNAQSVAVSLCTPVSIQAGDQGFILLKATDDAGLPATGMAGDILCYIKYPDGTLFINGAHPTETISGTYVLSFESTVTGIYYCWAICNHSGIQTMDAGLFQIGNDITDDATHMLLDRINVMYSSGRSDRYNTTRQMCYMLSTTQAPNITRTTEKTDLLQGLQETAISQSINILLWTIVLSIFSVFSIVVSMRHRKPKVVRR